MLPPAAHRCRSRCFACLCWLATACCCLPWASRGQCEEGHAWDFDESAQPEFSLGRAISDAFTPQVVQDTRRIRAYIRDERFRQLVQRCGDMRAVDGIYLKALRVAEHNIARGLFLALMAVLEHQNVNIKVPIVQSVTLPLTFEEDTLFKARFRNLPSRVYSDTPREGDRDKLQHFFASAYIAYASESPGLARTAGDLVEWGEARFVVGGSDDPRDRRANKQGEQFGRDLLVVTTLLPSDYLTLPYEDSR